MLAIFQLELDQLNQHGASNNTNTDSEGKKAHFPVWFSVTQKRLKVIKVWSFCFPRLMRHGVVNDVCDAGKAFPCQQNHRREDTSVQVNKAGVVLVGIYSVCLVLGESGNQIGRV